MRAELGIAKSTKLHMHHQLKWRFNDESEKFGQGISIRINDSVVASALGADVSMLVVVDVFVRLSQLIVFLFAF